MRHVKVSEKLASKTSNKPRQRMLRRNQFGRINTKYTQASEPVHINNEITEFSNVLASLID